MLKEQMNKEQGIWNGDGGGTIGCKHPERNRGPRAESDPSYKYRSGFLLADKIYRLMFIQKARIM